MIPKEKKVKLILKNCNLEIAYRLKDGKETLLFIHGLGCSKEDYNLAYKYLENKDYSIITFDLPGFGNSSKPKNFSYSMQDQAEVVKLLISKLNLEKVHILGHSMGGVIGLILASKNQNNPNIKSFINGEGNLYPEDCGISLKTYPYSMKNFIKHGFKKILEGLRKSRNKLDKTWYNNVCKSTGLAFWKSSKSLVDWSYNLKLLPMFTGLKMKKFYVYGEKNKNFPTVKTVKQTKIPCVQIQKSGHVMMLENPKNFYQTLFKLIKTN